MYLVLFLLFRVVFYLSISIAPTVTIGVDTPVQWTRDRRDSESFDLYLNSLDNDEWSVETSGRSGQYHIVLSTSWSPGSYNLLAQFWDNGQGVDASTSFELVAPAPPPPQTTTITTSATETLTTGPISTTSTSSNSSSSTTSHSTSTTHSTTLPSSVSQNTTSATHGSTTSSSQPPSQTPTIGPTSTTSSNLSSQTSDIPSPSATVTPTSSTSQTGLPIILGGVLGAVVLLVLLALLIFCCWHRRRRPMISPFRELAPSSTEPVNNSETRNNPAPERPEDSATSLIPGFPAHEEGAIPYVPPVTSPVLVEEKDFEADPMLNHNAAIAEIDRLRSEVERLRLSRLSGPPAYNQ